MRSVLYVGCPHVERPAAERELASASVSVIWTDTAAGALGELRHRNVPILLDLSRGPHALQLARKIRAQRAETLMFAVVDPRRPDLTTEAVLAGMADVFARPLAGRRVANALDRDARGSGPSSSARPPAPGGESPAALLYGHSPAMRHVMALIGRAATMRAGVMIRGEDGTGRQLAARAIHAAQNGHAGPFIAVDCAAHEHERDLDFTLFGANGRPDRRNHRAGPSDAAGGLECISAASRLYAARGGTLYLQNIVEAPTRVQARLARVLRDREAVLTETGDAISVDVRPVAGVDVAFDHAVADGQVRDDLVRRLSVVRIDMPALRNRREDIPALANCLLHEICAELGLPTRTLSRPALAFIAALPWRGNATELRTLLHSVVSASPGGRNIALEDALACVRLDGAAVASSSGGTLKQARARFEREYIAAILDENHGRIAEAARALGVQRTNLYRKIRALRIKKATPARRP